MHSPDPEFYSSAHAHPAISIALHNSFVQKSCAKGAVASVTRGCFEASEYAGAYFAQLSAQTDQDQLLLRPMNNKNTFCTFDNEEFTYINEFHYLDPRNKCSKSFYSAPTAEASIMSRILNKKQTW